MVLAGGNIYLSVRGFDFDRGQDMLVFRQELFGRTACNEEKQLHETRQYGYFPCQQKKQRGINVTAKVRKKDDSHGSRTNITRDFTETGQQEYGTNTFNSPLFPSVKEDKCYNFAPRTIQYSPKKTMLLSSETLFLCGFVLFIATILIVDMLVIDKKAHEVSIKEAGIWTSVWIILALAFSVFLWFKGDIVHGIADFNDLQAVASRYAAHLKLNPASFEDSLQQYRHYMTVTYISGYLIEKTLSVDNLFVMMMIFASFGVGKDEYQHVLNWGILGAIILRFVFIFLGSAVISRFDWVLLLFGAVLIYSAVKMYRGNGAEEKIEVEKHPVVRLLSKTGRIHPQFAGDRFFIRQEGKWLLTPLFVTVLVIEFSDLIFAFDSIPAVFSVTLDPYVVFFSNVFAILGLRAMFFLLAAIADKFRYLKTGVSVLLLFIGAKMLVHNWVEIDAVLSLVIIITVLVVSIGASMLLPQKTKQ